MLDQGKGCVQVWCYYFIQDKEGKSERQQLGRDVEEVREQAVGLPNGRAFQAEGTINAIVLAGQSIWCASKFQGVLWCSGFDMVQCIWHSLKRVWCCCLCFSHNLWSSAFHRWRTQESNVCSAPSVLAIPEIRSETFWSMMRDRELEYTSCRDDSIHAKCQSTSGYQL